MVWLSSKMKRYFILVFMLVFLTLGCFQAFAYISFDYEDPLTYMITIALIQNGVDVGDSDHADDWAHAYRLYAQHRGDVNILSMIDSMGNLKSNDYCENFYLLYTDVRDWIENLGVSVADGICYSPLTPYAPVEWPDRIAYYDAVQAVPFSISGSESYEPLASGQLNYLFSLFQLRDDSDRIYKYNFYTKDSIDNIFGIVSAGRHNPVCWNICLYKVNGNSYDVLPVSRIGNEYLLSDHSGVYSNGYGVSNFASLDISVGYDELCNFPFPIFLSETDALAYCRTGTVEKAVRQNSFPLEFSAFYPDLWKKEISSIGSVYYSGGPGVTYVARPHIDRIISAANSYDSLETAYDRLHVLDFEWSNIPFTVNYYYDGILKRTELFSISPNNNIVSEVPISEDGFYKLSDTPYDPPLPFAVDAQHNSISVRYVSRAADSVVKGATGAVSGVGRFLVSILPYALVIVGIVLFTILSIRLYKRLVNKA